MTEKPPLHCGFIGLGDQGAPLARRMVEGGFATTLWARREASLAVFADTEARIAHTIAELGAACDHVGICVLDDAGVADVCGQLIPVMHAGAVIAIHSTVSAALCRALAAQAAEHGILLIDAPVSGGAPAAKAGTLTVMVGGSEEAFAHARPVFASFAALIVRLGDVGAGQFAKLVNNTLLAANLTAAQNALDAGNALGLERDALAQLLRASSGNSVAVGIAAALPGLAAFAQGAALLRKDAGLLAGSLTDNAAIAALHAAAMPFLDAVAAAPRASS